MTATVHVIGAGVSGLSAAVHLASRGHDVRVYEAAAHAGGRCRSYYDRTLDQKIDNGNHLALSGNRAIVDYLNLIGARETMWEPERAEFPFLDLENDERWTVRPDPGRIPWSLFSSDKRVPGSSIREYLNGLRLATAGSRQTAQACLDRGGPLYRRFWEPLAVSVLNTDASEASAGLLWPVLRETFGRGESACRPMIPKQGLSETFVDPAIGYLEANGGQVMFGQRLKSLTFEAGYVSRLDFADCQIGVSKQDRIVLAVPPSVAKDIVSDIVMPDQFRAIVNAHFRIPFSASEVSFLGLVGGIGQWLFVRGDVASVTVSAAEELAEQSAEKIAEQMWPEIARALDLGDEPIGIYRIVKEKRATFAQTPEQVLKRPPATTRWENLVLAGDWTDTGLPATIEGSIQSGEKAAQLSGKSA